MILSHSEVQGRAIAAARLLAGLDQAGLAQLAGVSASTVSNVERGSDAREDTIVSIKKALRKAGITSSIDKVNGRAIIVATYEEPDEDE